MREKLFTVALFWLLFVGGAVLYRHFAPVPTLQASPQVAR